MSRVTDNYNAVKSNVAEACRNCGRNPDEVKLLVVSKTIPVDIIMELYQSGIREFAENREPELAMKKASMPEDIKWHFIGPVQSNKIRKVVRMAEVIHSVESLSQLEKFERIAGEEGVCPEIYLEVNVSGEKSKGGMTPEELPAVAAVAAKCINLRCRGLMTMAPINADEKMLKKVFSGLCDLRDKTMDQFNIELPVLSMGMSGDFAEAVNCGSTVVRVGSRIFEGIERISK